MLSHFDSNLGYLIDLLLKAVAFHSQASNDEVIPRIAEAELNLETLNMTLHQIYIQESIHFLQLASNCIVKLDSMVISIACSERQRPGQIVVRDADEGKTGEKNKRKLNSETGKTRVYSTSEKGWKALLPRALSGRGNDFSTKLILSRLLD